MDTKTENTLTKQVIDDYLLTWQEAFITDRLAASLTPKTISFYKFHLDLFNRYAESQIITRISQITPDTLRQFMLWLTDSGHVPGGIHGSYRTIRAFLKWYENEVEPEGWKNPINKVRAPKVDLAPLEPVSMDTVTKMLDACKPRGSFLADRDKALILALLDTGARANELLNLTTEDLNLATGAILIRKSKSRKPRTVFLGCTARKAMRAYMRHLPHQTVQLWLTKSKVKMTYTALRSMIRRRTPEGQRGPSIHSFRRAFALSMLRAGTDVFTLAQILGHSDLTIMRRYLLTDTTDSKAAHAKGSPADHLTEA